MKTHQESKAKHRNDAATSRYLEEYLTYML